MMRRWKRMLPGVLAVAVFGLAAGCEQAEAQEEGGPMQVLLITGGGWHDYEAQKGVLEAGITARTSNVAFTIDHEAGDQSDVKISRHEDTDWAEEFDLVLYNMCFAEVSDDEWTERIVHAHVEHDVPAVLLHCAAHSYSFQGEALIWDDFMGVVSNRHQSHMPFTVEVLEPGHPVMADFPDGWETPEGELYEIVEVKPTATPLAHSYGEDSGEHHVNVWVNEYEGVRVFATTIGHHNATMETEEYLDLVTSGLLWAAEELGEDGEATEAYRAE